MRHLSIVLFTCGGLLTSDAFGDSDTDKLAPALPFSHELLDKALSPHVDTAGRVDYPTLKSSRAVLDRYIDSVAAVSPRTHPERFPTAKHQLAYWINAYNAFVLKGVIDAYPVESVSEIGGLDGFFRQKTFVAGGQVLTLDKIESGIIRPEFKDARIHFAVNCAAVSCPPLEAKTFTAEDLDPRLDAALERFLTDPFMLRIDRAGNKIHLSRLLEWYRQDFVDWLPTGEEGATPPDKPTLLDYLTLYLPEIDADYLRRHPDVAISFNEYDWSLNVQK